ncbi:hypothetical protein ACLOJK_039186, partial [Asimina triloba]
MVAPPLPSFFQNLNSLASSIVSHPSPPSPFVPSLSVIAFHRRSLTLPPHRLSTSAVPPPFLSHLLAFRHRSSPLPSLRQASLSLLSIHRPPQCLRHKSSLSIVAPPQSPAAVEVSLSMLVVQASISLLFLSLLSLPVAVEVSLSLLVVEASLCLLSLFVLSVHRPPSTYFTPLPALENHFFSTAAGGAMVAGCRHRDGTRPTTGPTIHRRSNLTTQIPIENSAAPPL